MIHRCNSTCQQCTKAHNAINGRFCEALCRIVEYDKEPPCGGQLKQK